MDLDKNLKKIFNYMIKKNEEENKFLENLESMKNKIKKNDFEDINNWDYYKKKDKSDGLIKKRKIGNITAKGVFDFNKTMTSDLMLNLHNYIKFKNFSISYVNKKFKNLIIDKFTNINLKKINFYKNKEFYKIQSIVVIILDLRSLKSKIIVMNKFKCLSHLTNGMIFKKLQLRNKKYKKSEKLTYFIIKNMLVKMNNFSNYKNIIINIKGVKKSINNIINYLNKKIQKKNKSIIYINNSKFSFNSKFKFKKIKAIKRRLRKKIIRFK